MRSDETPSGRAAWPLAYEVCHPAFVLRALLLVQLALVSGALLVVGDWTQALPLLGPAVAAGLVGSMLWLSLVCSARATLARMGSGPRWAALLGGAAMLAPLACAPLLVFGLMDWHAPRALALPLVGAGLALPLVAWLEGRQRSRRPADASARLAELQSRIRPHFLFNALNSAIALVRVDPSRAESVLEDLAELFRVALAVPGTAVTLADELELARRYLAIEQVRFGERLELVWDLDARTDGARVPPLLLQPLVENAVRHGIEPAATGGRIEVRTTRRLGQVEITIDNTVPDGEHPTAGNGMALANVRERLRLMHDLAAQFEVARHAGGFRVRVVIPLEAGP